MVLWIIFGASILVGLYILQRGQQFIAAAAMGNDLRPCGILFQMMFCWW